MSQKKAKKRASPRSKPAGNAQYDPRQQTVRTDMPKNRQRSAGERARGTQPSQEGDRSNQPHPHDSSGPP
jgi:hypothetical protein